MTIATGTFPTGVAIDPVARRLYWADNGTDTITRTDLASGTRPGEGQCAPIRAAFDHALPLDENLTPEEAEETNGGSPPGLGHLE